MMDESGGFGIANLFSADAVLGCQERLQSRWQRRGEFLPRCNS
jgi:hypothetical protein